MMSNNLYTVFEVPGPSLMQKLIETGDTDKHKTIFLSNNFRSKEAIVAYNNHLFSHLMNVDDFNSSYDEFDSVTPELIIKKLIVYQLNYT